MLDRREPTLDIAAVDERLAELLITRGKLRDMDLVRVARIQEGPENREPLSRLIVKLGMVSERDTAEALSDLLELPLAQSADYPDLSVLNGQISARFLKENLAVPIAEDADKVALVMADPQDVYVSGGVEV